MAVGGARPTKVGRLEPRLLGAQSVSKPPQKRLAGPSLWRFGGVRTALVEVQVGKHDLLILVYRSSHHRERRWTLSTDWIFS